MLAFYKNLERDIPLPEGISWIDPFDALVLKISKTYHKKYYNDKNKRYFLFGINPGRFGAGVTGIPFTDPIYLESVFGIKNDLDKRHELSSIFIHDMIKAYGSIDKFTENFYISSLCPLGFIKNGKNINYYDEKRLEKKVTPFIESAIEAQLKIGANPDLAISLGIGKNFKFFKKLNERKNYFKDVIALPHPRWIMQYKSKDKNKYIKEYLKVLNSV